MAKEFKDLLASMLQELDKGKSVTEIINAAVKNEGLSAEAQNNVAEAVDYIDKINEASKDLEEAKTEGLSREEWLSEKIEQTIDALPEDLREKAELSKSGIISIIFNNLQK